MRRPQHRLLRGEEECVLQVKLLLVLRSKCIIRLADADQRHLVMTRQVMQESLHMPVREADDRDRGDLLRRGKRGSKQ